MRTRIVMSMIIVLFTFAFVQLAFAEKKMPENITLKLEGAKMAPVTFSHTIHTQKVKVACKVCHHKDKDVKEAQACVKCHLPQEVKNNAPIAKDAFHTRCQTCHKENAAKGVKAPTKCLECHKK